ncbi:retrovirus-related pol polyprotein from transposon TNT 1-94 [Tanacetum coccineum]
MILLARAITQKFSTPTNNHLRTSSNIRNQAVIPDGRVDTQTKNEGYSGNGNKNAGRQDRNQTFNAGTENDESNQIVQRVPQTESAPRKANVQCYNCNEKGHYAHDFQKLRVHDAKTVNEVNASSKVHEQVSHVKCKTIIQTYDDDDQIDFNIIFDDPYVENNGGTSEHDSNAHDEYHEIQMLAYNVQREAKNKKRLNNELKKQEELLQKDLETSGLGYKNPERLKKAIAAQPKMYDGEMLYSAKLKIDSPDSKETLEGAKESRLKMRNKMVQIKYEN